MVSESDKTPSFNQRLSAYSLITFFYFISFCPVFVQKVIAKLVAVLSWYLIRSRRKITLKNFELCFEQLSTTEQIRLAKHCFYKNILGYFQTASSWCRPASRFRNTLTTQGLEHLTEAIKSPKGTLIVGGHFTILDMAGALLSLLTPYHSVYRHHNNPLLNQFMIRSRLRFIKSCIDRKDIKTMIRTLKKGDVMWYAPDQDYGRKHSIFIDFFNHPAATITATSRLAKLGQANVLFMSYFEVSHKKYELRFFKPENFPSGDDYKDAQIYNQWLSDEIKQYPTQYLWLHKRFKTRPIGEKSLY